MKHMPQMAAEVRRERAAGARRAGLIKARDTKYGLLFVAPALLYFLVFYLYPLTWAIYISLHDWNVLGSPHFVGLQNYLRLLQDREFRTSFGATLYYTFGTVVPIWVLALALALVFNQPLRFRRAYLTVYYVPAVISLTVWSLLWLLMYHPTWGLLTLVTRPLGFTYVRWLSDAGLAMPALILLSIWKGTPAYMLIYLAGLRAIPAEYHEAAAIDGANWLQRLRYVTLPLLRPVFLYVAVISIIAAFQVFTPAYLLTGGGPGSATRVLPMFIYQTAFQFLKMGYASAASILLFLVLLVFTVIQFRLLSRRAE